MCLLLLLLLVHNTLTQRENMTNALHRIERENTRSNAKEIDIYFFMSRIDCTIAITNSKHTRFDEPSTQRCHRMRTKCMYTSKTKAKHAAASGPLACFSCYYCYCCVMTHKNTRHRIHSAVAQHRLCMFVGRKCDDRACKIILISYPST